jgi:hypothetical protein
MGPGAICSAADPRWAMTLPHLVRPLPAEALVGFVLRCDRANAWPAGSTAALVGLRGRTAEERKGASMAPFATPPPGAVAALARLVDLPIAEIEALAWPEGVRVGQIGAFAICPACIADGWLIRRADGPRWYGTRQRRCSLHRRALRSVCACGTGLRPFSPAAPPFHCRHCRRSWGTLTQPSDVGALDALKPPSPQVMYLRRLFGRR